MKFAPVNIMVAGDEQAWTDEITKELQTAVLKKPQRMAHITGHDQAIRPPGARPLRKVEVGCTLGWPIVQVSRDKNAHGMIGSSAGVGLPRRVDVFRFDLVDHARTSPGWWLKRRPAPVYFFGQRINVRSPSVVISTTGPRICR